MQKWEQDLLILLKTLLSTLFVSFKDLYFCGEFGA